MASQNKTISIYPEGSLVELLDGFKKERNLKSLNVAILAILNEYFTSNVPSTLPSGDKLSELVAEIESLKKRVSSIEQSTLSGTLSSTLLDRAESSNLSEILESSTQKQVIDIESESIEPVQVAHKPVQVAKGKQITYNLAPDGSIVHRSLKGTDIRTVQKMSDEKLASIGLERRGEKFYPLKDGK